MKRNHDLLPLLAASLASSSGDAMAVATRFVIAETDPMMLTIFRHLLISEESTYKSTFQENF